MKTHYVIFTLVLSAMMAACSDSRDNNQGVESQEKTNAVNTNTKHAPQTGKKQPDLNLSIENLPPPTADEVSGVDYVDSRHSLQDAFDQSKKDKNTNLKAGVLREDGNEDYMDSINGAEVSVELKIQ